MYKHENTNRIVEYDSLKGVLIVLVIFGHLIEPYIDKSFAYKSIYTAIYVFHMPLFVLLSGVFAKGVLVERDYESLLRQVLLPLVVSQVICFGWFYWSSGELPHSFFRPHWTLWYLLSLAIWKILLPLIVRSRWILIIAVVSPLLAGYVKNIGYNFSLSRTFYFMPIFLLGFYRGKALIAWASTRKAISFILLSCPLILAIAAIESGLSYKILRGSLSYAISGPHLVEPSVERAIIICLSIVASIGFSGLFLRYVPKLAYLGQRSLTIYIVHGVVALVVEKAIKALGLNPSLPMLSALLAFAILTAFALAPIDKPFKAIFAWLGNRVVRRKSTIGF